MARISRTGTTDSTGVASTTITGSGGGRLKFISRNGELWSNSYEVLDCSYIETIPNGSLTQGAIRHQNIGNSSIELSDEWATVGTHSIKSVNRSSGWSAYRIYSPISINNTITIEFDYKSDKPFNAFMIFGRRNETEVVTRLNGLNGEGTATITLSTTPSSELTYVDLRPINNTSEWATIYFDNIRIYSPFTAPSHYTPIALSSSASIIQTGESATLTAELTNVLGEKLAQKSVNFIEKSKPIHSFDGTVNTGEWIGDVTATATDDGVHLTSTVTNNFLLKDGSQLFIPVSKSFKIEFTGIINNVCAFYISTSNNTRGTNVGTLNPLSPVRTANYKFEWSDGVMKFYIDDVLKTTTNLNLSSVNYCGICFTDWQNDLNIYLKDFKITIDDIIDTETSNSQGVATTIPITSNGTGERQFIATNSSILSETYSLYDCLYYDDGMTSASNGFIFNTTDIQLNVDGTGTTVTNSSSSTGRTYWINKKNTASNVDLDWDYPIAVECDILNGSDSVAFQFGRQSDNQIVSRTLTQLGLTNGGHLKFTFDGTNARYFVNNSNTALFTVPLQISDLSVIRFYCPPSTTLKYKNFMIYPI